MQATDLTDIIIRIKSTGETVTLDNQFDQEDGVDSTGDRISAGRDAF